MRLQAAREDRQAGAGHPGGGLGGDDHKDKHRDLLLIDRGLSNACAIKIDVR
jgi:hypothetical protein